MLVLLYGTFVCSAHAPRYDQTLRLGGQRKHQKLKFFKARFPSSVCGEPIDPSHINRHTLNDPSNSDWLVCCIDDPGEVSAFSEFTVLSRDRNCPVLVDFYRKRLHNIVLAVDATSVEAILPKLERVYGRVHHVRTVGTTIAPVRFALWNYGDVTLEVNEELLVLNDFEIVPPPNRRTSDARIVLLTLF
jgi:hypothetical protein